MDWHHNLIKWMDRRFYPETVPPWDHRAYRDAVLAVLQPKHVVLDLGAGAGLLAETNFRGRAARVCGVDPDPRIVENPYLDEAKVAYAENLPYPDNTFDVVVCCNVLEHLERPESVFREVHRVLKPSGRFIVKTPNRWHYVPLGAACTPHWFHERVKSRLFGRASADTFVTRYRANTKRDLQRHAANAGLEVLEVRMLEDRPEYLRFSVPTYLVGLAFERCVNSFDALRRLRIVMIATMVKPGRA